MSLATADLLVPQLILCSTTGTHPELIHLTKLIEMRRTRKLELAQKWLEGLEGAYERHKEEEEHAIWTYWAVSRSNSALASSDR